MKLIHGLLYPHDYELMPWEPVIGKAGYGFTQAVFTPNPDDTCDECGREMPEDFTQMISTGDNGFCSWECLEAKVKRFPEFYNDPEI